MSQILVIQSNDNGLWGNYFIPATRPKERKPISKVISYHKIIGRLFLLSVIELPSRGYHASLLDQSNSWLHPTHATHQPSVIFKEENSPFFRYSNPSHSIYSFHYFTNLRVRVIILSFIPLFTILKTRNHNIP